MAARLIAFNSLLVHSRERPRACTTTHTVAVAPCPLPFLFLLRLPFSFPYPVAPLSPLSHPLSIHPDVFSLSRLSPLLYPLLSRLFFFPIRPARTLTCDVNATTDRPIRTWLLTHEFFDREMHARPAGCSSLPEQILSLDKPSVLADPSGNQLRVFPATDPSHSRSPDADYYN